MACLRPLLLLCVATLLAACSSSPSSTLGELPRTPQASTQQLLKQAEQSDAEQAAQLRLAAADHSSVWASFPSASRFAASSLAPKHWRQTTSH